jgi:hypothetical protein
MQFHPSVLYEFGQILILSDSQWECRARDTIAQSMMTSSAEYLLSGGVNHEWIWSEALVPKIAAIGCDYAEGTRENETDLCSLTLSTLYATVALPPYLESYIFNVVLVLWQPPHVIRNKSFGKYWMQLKVKQHYWQHHLDGLQASVNAKEAGLSKVSWFRSISYFLGSWPFEYFQYCIDGCLVDRRIMWKRVCIRVGR